MNAQREPIETLLERYFEATATEAEERELRTYFRETEELPAELEYARALFGGLDELAAECLPEQPSERSFPVGQPRILSTDTKPEERPPLGGRSLRPLPIVWGAVAAAVLLAGLFIGLEHFRQPYCYIDGVAVYDREVAMQTTVYLDGLSVLDTSNRMVDELIRNN